MKQTFSPQKVPGLLKNSLLRAKSWQPRWKNFCRARRKELWGRIGRILYLQRINSAVASLNPLVGCFPAKIKWGRIFHLPSFHRPRSSPGKCNCNWKCMKRKAPVKLSSFYQKVNFAVHLLVRPASRRKNKKKITWEIVFAHSTNFVTSFFARLTFRNKKKAEKKNEEKTQKKHRQRVFPSSFSAVSLWQTANEKAH